MSAGTEEPRVEVLAPCSKAYDHMKEMLFPFTFEKWLVLAFVAFLVSPFIGGVPTGSDFKPSAFRHGATHYAYPGESISTVVSFVETHVAIIAVAFLIGLAIYLLLAYLSSRALFVYMDCVVHRSAAFVDPWKRGAKFANAFFLGRLVIDVICGGALIAVFAVAAAASWGLLRQGVFSPELAGIFALTVLFAAPIALALVVLRWLYSNLVGPIMYIKDIGVLAAWGELWRLAKGRLAEFILYALLNLALYIGYAILCVPVMCCTCCVAMLPVVHQMVFQPLLLWFRAYPFYFLAQFGESYAALIPAVSGFSPAATPAPLETPPAPPVAPPAPAVRVVNCTQCGQPHQVLGGPGVYLCSRCGARFEAT